MSLLRKWRRRQPGIYLERTRKHNNPRKRENGYVGLSNNTHMRKLDHRGLGRYGAKAKPWSDLDPQQHVLRLPWWLGFRWTMAPIEVLAIRLLLPRYNVMHNRGNFRRVPLVQQHAERALRDLGGPVLRSHRRVLDVETLAVRACGVALLALAVFMGAVAAWS